MSSAATAELAPAAPLRRNVAWTLAGNVTYSACQWGIFIVLARLGTVEMVGEFALAFAIVTPVFLFSQLQLRSLQSTDASYTEFRPGDYVALRLVTTGLALAVVAMIAVVAGYRREVALVVICAGLARAFDSLSDVFYGRLQQHEDMASIARSMMLRGLLSIGVVGAVVWLTHSAALAAAGLAGAWAMALLLHDVPRAASAGVAAPAVVWDKAVLWKLARKASPLGVVTLLGSLDANIPRYFIAHDLGERALGLFAGVASLQAAGTILVNAMGQSASPRLARYHLLGQSRSFRRLLGRLFLLALLPGAALVGVALVAGDFVPRLLFGPAYGGERTLFVWLALAVAIWLPTSVLGYAATAMRRIRFQPYALGAVAGTTFAACAFAVPRLGVLGGAAANVGSAAVACVLFGMGVL